MAVNPMTFLKIRKMWGEFTEAHPKFLPFFRDLSSSGYLGEGSVIDITVTEPEGKSLRYNMRLTQEDLELMREIANLGRDH